MKVLKAILLILLLAAGAVAFLFLSKKQEVAQSAGWTEGIALHGRFCGPGHPFVDSFGTPAEARRLESIEPQDSLDAACKSHDLCYVREGFFDEGCDRALAGRLRTLADRFAQQAESGAPDDLLCAQMAAMTADYVLARAPGPGEASVVEAFFQDATDLSIELRGAGDAFYEFYIEGEHDVLRCDLR